ncbi:MAG: hypothetical protein NZL85_09205, partial [Fimbriimonadales bacterium]|nr:hypothetical protein [Fimbriimonadales bacterium]
MRRYWLAGCLALLMSFGATQEADAPYLDGAMRPEPPETRPTKPPTLVAPQVKPTRVLLPPTEMPTLGNPSTGESTAHPILRVGYTLDAPPHLLGRAQWQRVQVSSPNGKQQLSGWAAHLELRSANAVGLRLQLQRRPHPQMAINIYDPNGSVVLPTRAYPDEEGKWWAPSLWRSDTIGIELFVPDTVEMQQLPEIVAIG